MEKCEVPHSYPCLITKGIPPTKCEECGRVTCGWSRVASVKFDEKRHHICIECVLVFVQTLTHE